MSLAVIRRRTLPFTIGKKNLRFERRLVGRILALGTPIALQDLLVSISFLVILAIVNSMGVIASAGVGVAEKLCAFIMLVASAYMQSMSAFVAQNMGGGEAGAGETCPALRDRNLPYGRGDPLLFFVFPRRCHGGDLCQGPAGGGCGCRLSKGIRHRLYPYVVPVLLCGIFQWMR